MRDGLRQELPAILKACDTIAFFCRYNSMSEEGVLRTSWHIEKRHCGENSRVPPLAGPGLLDYGDDEVLIIH